MALILWWEHTNGMVQHQVMRNLEVALGQLKETAGDY
jgi:hypothetical protein